MTYVVRQINLSIKLGTGNFGTGGADTVALTGLRVNAQLSNVLLPGATTAVIQVWGLPLSLIQQITTAGLFYGVRQNYITVQAGDVQAGLTTVFTGLIIEAVPDFEQPDSPLVISATVTADLQLAPVPPGTFQGSTDVATMMGQMAGAAGLTLENNGVSVKLSNRYFPGTIMQQIQACARAANIYAYVDRAAGALVICPKGGSRAGAPIVISPANGQIGYPKFQRNLMIVRTLFDPNIKQLMQIQEQSQLQPANGIWTIFQLDADLASQLPDGPWEMILSCVSPVSPS